MDEQQSYPDQQFSPYTARVRDLEEKIRLLKDRTLLIGKTLVDENGKTISELREMKKDLFVLKEENKRIKDLLIRITEQLSSTSRKEELLILQRQFDLFRENKAEHKAGK